MVTESTKAGIINNGKQQHNSIKGHKRLTPRQPRTLHPTARGENAKQSTPPGARGLQKNVCI
eukprot:5792494-Amphidinium_carterae.1